MPVFYSFLSLIYIIIGPVRFTCNANSSMFWSILFVFYSYCLLCVNNNKCFRVPCYIIPYFCLKLGKISQNSSSAAVVIGALRVNQLI